jgi:hypothetical protein
MLLQQAPQGPAAGPTAASLLHEQVSRQGQQSQQQ